LWWCRVSGLVPKIGRGVRRGSAKRAPLLKPCLPARAGGEPPQRESQADKGVVRPAAEGEDTAPQDAQYFTVAVGDRRSPSFFLFLAAQRRSAQSEPRAAPQRSLPVRAHRHGPGRPWPKVCALARRDRAQAIRTGRMGRDVAGGSRSAGWSLERGDTPKGRGRGHVHHAFRFTDQ